MKNIIKILAIVMLVTLTANIICMDSEDIKTEIDKNKKALAKKEMMLSNLKTYPVNAETTRLMNNAETSIRELQAKISDLNNQYQETLKEEQEAAILIEGLKSGTLQRPLF